MATRAVSLVIPFTAWDAASNVPKTGDSANITMRWVKDGTSSALTTTTVTEIDSTNAPGVYKCSLSSTETDCDIGVLCGKSSTASIAIMPVLIQFERLPNAAAGASGGVLISGSNSGTTTLGALTVSGATTLTGNVSMAAGLTVTQSSANTSAISITGNGTGHGISVTSGSGATGNGINITSSATNGSGVAYAGAGTGDGFKATGGATGRGMHAIGGATSGAGFRTEGTAGNSNATEYAGQGSANGLSVTGGATGASVAIVGGGTSGAGIAVTTTSGDGFTIQPTAGHAILATGNGTSKHGAVITGGTAGTSDGVKAVAGTGGVPIRGDITGNITGTLSGGVTVTTNNDKTGYSLSQAFPSNFSSMAIDGSGNVSINGRVKKNTALSKFMLKMVLSSDHISAATGKTVTVQRSLDGAAFANTSAITATEVSNGWYYIDLVAGDLNGNTVVIRATATSCDATEITIVTQP